MPENTPMGSRANRTFESSPQAVPTVTGFVGGSNAEEEWGVVRIVDGHNPTATGNKGSNVHSPGSSADPAWDSPFSEYDPDIE